MSETIFFLYVVLTGYVVYSNLHKCQHSWEHAGQRIRTWKSGRTEIKPILSCTKCGSKKVAY